MKIIDWDIAVSRQYPWKPYFGIHSPKWVLPGDEDEYENLGLWDIFIYFLKIHLYIAWVWRKDSNA